MKPGHTAGGVHRRVKAGPEDERVEVMTPASWRQLAEEAMLVEMTLSGRDSSQLGKLHISRNWAAYGIPADELAFFDYWQKSLDTTLLDADGRLGRFLEARQLYQSVEALMRQKQEQEAFFALMGNRYQIPVDHFRSHFLNQQPSTTGQWATFVAQHQSK